MTKNEFLNKLRLGLSGIPREDLEERLEFYGEMIDDRTEEGLSEEEAVRAVGDAAEIISQTVAEIPLGRLVKEKISPKRRLGVLEAVLLIIGSPIWLSLLIALLAVLFSLYAVIWSVIASVWAVFAAFAVSAVGSIPLCALFAAWGSITPGLAMLSAGLVCAGLSVFMFFACVAATKGTVLLTKKSVSLIKKAFIKGERA